MLPEAEVMIPYLETGTGEPGNPLCETDEGSLPQRKDRQRNFKKDLLPGTMTQLLGEGLTNPLCELVGS